MSLSIEGSGIWRPGIERAQPIRAADPLANGASISPWQALMAAGALASTYESGEWRARIEPGAPLRRSPILDDPERIETAEVRETKPSLPAKSAPAPEPPGLFENDEISFADFLDLINPLQHIPIISTIYRELTGDRIGHAARLAGGLMFLGPLGGMSALANIVIVEASGKDLGDHALALFKDDTAHEPALAANTNAAPSPIADEKALAELLPPGAIPLPGRRVDFAQAAPRPDRGASFNARGDSPAHPTALVPAAAPAPSADDDDLPPPPPPGPIAGPGWKGFYSPPVNPEAMTRAAESTRRAHAPDPMAALAAKRTPGAMAGTLTPGAIAEDGGWFADAMLTALAKYDEARRLRALQAPEAARQGAVNIVN